MCLILNQSLEMHQATVMRCTINSSTETYCLQSNARASWPLRPNSLKQHNMLKRNSRFLFGNSSRLLCFSAKLRCCNLSRMQQHSSTVTCYFHHVEMQHCVIIFIPSCDLFNTRLQRKQYCTVRLA